MSYMALREEVDVREINARALADGKALFLPKVLGAGEMCACRVESLEGLARGAMGIFEPDGSAAEQPECLEIVLVPGVAFDRNGGRIGFGGGYYDRFLPRTGALRIAIAFEVQIVEDACVLAHDRKMDMLITERRAYDLRGLQKDRKNTEKQADQEEEK